MQLLNDNVAYTKDTENISILGRTLELRSMVQEKGGNALAALQDHREFKLLSDSLSIKKR